MAVRIVLLGRLQDVAGFAETEAAAPLDWPGLLEFAGPQLAAALADDRIRLASNGIVMADKSALDAQDGDEIALLPPVSGG